MAICVKGIRFWFLSKRLVFSEQRLGFEMKLEMKQTLGSKPQLSLRIYVHRMITHWDAATLWASMTNPNRAN